jgi:hypothetical protein
MWKFRNLPGEDPGPPLQGEEKEWQGKRGGKGREGRRAFRHFLFYKLTPFCKLTFFCASHYAVDTPELAAIIANRWSYYYT